MGIECPKPPHISEFGSVELLAADTEGTGQ